MKRSFWFPELITHTYWHEKENFLMNQDTYLTWVLFAVVEGTFDYRIQEEEGEATYGDVVICPPYIAFHRQTRGPLSFHAITFDFPEEEKSFPLKLMTEHKVSLGRSTRLSENYDWILKEDRLQKWSRDQKRRKQHYFHDLWLMILDVYRPLEEIEEERVMDTQIKAIAEYIEEHAFQKLEIKQVAAHFTMTPVQLIRRFHASYHINPLQYLTSLRVKKTANLLLQTDWSLDVIAQECGYENGFYLSRVFNKQMGMSPSFYRAQNRF